mmetsp:Transcript_49339/g.97597  ORF Transcript_49339/g.97597 Transcript_49339/m.97597 type:complete len:177 (-) Transcript_49339:98-628(-)
MVYFFSPRFSRSVLISSIRSNSRLALSVVKVGRREPSTSPESIRLCSTGKKKEEKLEEKAPTIREKLKHIWITYGKLAMVTYFGLYAGTFATFCFTLDHGIINTETLGFNHYDAVIKVCETLENITESSAVSEYVKENPKAGTFAAALFMTELTDPLRIFATITLVPFAAKYLSKK